MFLSLKPASICCAFCLLSVGCVHALRQCGCFTYRIKKEELVKQGQVGRLGAEGKPLSSAIHMFPSRRSVSVHSRLAPWGKVSPRLEFKRQSGCGFSVFFFFLLFFLGGGVVEPCDLPSPLLLLLLPLSPTLTGFQGPRGQRPLSAHSVHPSASPLAAET